MLLLTPHTHRTEHRLQSLRSSPMGTSLLHKLDLISMETAATATKQQQAAVIQGHVWVQSTQTNMNFKGTALSSNIT